MRLHILAVTVAALQFVAHPAAAQDLSRHFQGITGTFVLLDGQTGAFTRWNAARADQRFAPCSTFKIPNTAILLETGAAPDPEFVVKYDPALKASRDAWRQDHTLRSAYRDSVLWYYHGAVAKGRPVGGNAPGEAVRLWQRRHRPAASPTTPRSGSTARCASRPNEQVAFLKRLHENRLGLSERTARLTREIMIAEETPQGTLRAKTGACHPDGEGEVTLWYVGYVEKPARRLVLRARARRQGLRSADGAARPEGAGDPGRPRRPAVIAGASRG